MIPIEVHEKNFTPIPAANRHLLRVWPILANLGRP